MRTRAVSLAVILLCVVESAIVSIRGSVPCALRHARGKTDAPHRTPLQREPRRWPRAPPP